MLGQEIPPAGRRLTGVRYAVNWIQKMAGGTDAIKAFGSSAAKKESAARSLPHCCVTSLFLIPLNVGKVLQH